jgi:hypothetical protein
LITFISATSQITVNVPPALGNCSAPTNGIVTSVTTAPALTAMIAAVTCPRSLTSGGRSKTSSSAPTNAIRTAPAISPSVSTWLVAPPEWGVSGSRIECGIQIAAQISTAARIARPPSSGVSRAARPRSRGASTAPINRASRAASGVNTAVIAPATTNARTACQ